MTSEDLLAHNAALSGEVQRTQESLKIALLTIDKLKLELAYLRRMKYGRSSEQLEHAQLELVGGMVAAPATEPASNVTSIEAGRKKRAAKQRPGLRELPEHLPRRTVVHAAPSGHDGGCDCHACGRALREIGQDVSEVLDYEPGSFHVVRHVRPRLACTGCKTITQAAAPSRPVERGMAGPGLLAHVLVGKYADSLPLYRQCQIYAREGVLLERSTLTDWVGQAARLLTPLAQAIARHVLRADKIHGDDTPIRVLGGKGSKAKTGRLWVYVRDDRPHRGSNGDAIAPPAVWFQYSANHRVSTPHATSRAGVGYCRPTRSRATTSSMKTAASSKPLAGVMPGASCGTSTSASTSCPARWRIRGWSGSPRSSRSKPRSAASQPCGEGGCDNCRRGPYWTT
jgi:transposase